MNEVVLNELPDNWEWTKLGNVVTKIIGGGTPAKNKPQYWEGDIPWLTVKDMRSRRPADAVDHISEKAVEESSTNIIPEDTVIIATRIGLGKVIRVPYKAAINQDLKALVVPTEIDKGYLEYWFVSKANYLGSIGSGTTVKGIRLEQVRDLDFPLAPPEQQKRIVAKIDELFSHIDAGIEALKKAKQLLKQYRQSVLKAAVTGELTKEWREANKDKLEPASELLEKIEIARNAWIEKETAKDNSEAKRLKNKLTKHEFEELDSSSVPEGWESVSLTKLCLLVVDCHNKTAPYVESGIPLIRTSNIRDGVIKFKEKMKFVNQETYEYWSRRCPPEPGDILFTREAPMGESAIIPENTKVCMGQRMMLLRVILDLVDVEYLHIALMEPLFQKRVQGFKVGVGVPHLRVGDVEKAVVALPPFIEQKEIVRVASDRLDAITRLENELDQK